MATSAESVGEPAVPSGVLLPGVGAPTRRSASTSVAACEPSRPAGASVSGAGRLDGELERLGRIPPLVVDEVGFIPFDPEAASLSFALIRSRREPRSLIVSSNITFSA